MSKFNYRKQSRLGESFKTFFFLSIASLLICIGVRTYNAIQFDRKCEGHLKRAADANSVEMAEKELGLALNYMEANNLTTGYTSVIYTSPEDDVEFWYTNVKTSYDELISLSDSTTSLEKSNVLIKLRETLIDHSGESGDKVTVPPGIHNFPNNTAYFWWFVLSAVPFGILLTRAFFRLN